MSFRNSGRGSTTLGTALTIAGLIVAAGFILDIAMGAYEDDRMGRGAQAAARALALGSQVPPCDLVRQELAFGPEFECEGEWKIRVSRSVKPSEIAAQAQSGAGDMVVVRVGAQGSTAAMGLARAEPAE